MVSPLLKTAQKERRAPVPKIFAMQLFTREAPRKDEVFYRSFSIDRSAINEQARTVELSFSSDAEVPIFRGFKEVLSHADGAVHLDRLRSGGNCLFNHNRDYVVGVVERVWIEGGKGRAVIRFSKTEKAEAIWKDVVDGILRSVSVGYRILKFILKEEREAEEVWLVSEWEPLEISIVTVPVDTGVGVGRAQNQTENIDTDMLRYHRYSARRLMEGDKGNNPPGATPPAPAAPPAPPEGGNRSVPPEPAPSRINVENERRSAAEAERQRIADVMTACRQHNAPDIQERAIREGLGMDAVRQLLLDRLVGGGEGQPAVNPASHKIGMTDSEVRSFSVVKLMRHLSDPGNAAFREAAKFEVEACTAAADAVSHREVKGTVLPMDILLTPIGQGQRDIISVKTGAGYTGTGGATVATHLMADAFIDLLRNRSVLLSMATNLTGLVGNFDIPKQTSAATAGWIGEDVDAPATDIDFGLVSLRPKTVAAHSEITRKMLMQPSLGVEALVRKDLALAIALAIDLKGFYGDGTGDTPKGVLTTSGINSVEFAATNPTFAELVEMETRIATDNADVAAMRYVANASFRGYAKSTVKFAGTDGTIWEPGDTINGYKAEITNQIAAGDIFFGNFADLVVGQWGSIEISVDPYTQQQKGRIRVTAFQDVDFAVRRAESFCYGAKKEEAAGG